MRVIEKHFGFEGLEAVLTANPVTTARELAEKFGPAKNCPTPTVETRKDFRVWKMGPARPVPRESALGAV